MPPSESANLFPKLNDLNVAQTIKNKVSNEDEELLIEAIEDSSDEDEPKDSIHNHLCSVV